jgi:hypothetical protein
LGRKKNSTSNSQMDLGAVKNFRFHSEKGRGEGKKKDPDQRLAGV